MNDEPTSNECAFAFMEFFQRGTIIIVYPPSYYSLNYYNCESKQLLPTYEIQCRIVTSCSRYTIAKLFDSVVYVKNIIRTYFKFIQVENKVEKYRKYG